MTGLEFLESHDPFFGCRDTREEFLSEFGGVVRTVEEWNELAEVFSTTPEHHLLTEAVPGFGTALGILAGL